MTPAPKRRWLRFSLRSLFLLMTVVGCWFGSQVNIVHQRKATAQRIRAEGGFVWMVVTREVSPGKPARVWLNETAPQPNDQPLHRFHSLGVLRRWLGDIPIEQVDLPVGSTELEAKQAKAVFPESLITIGLHAQKQ